MNTRIFVSFNEGYRDFDGVCCLLARINCLDGLAGEDHILCGLYQYPFDAEDPRLGNLRSELKRAGIKWSERLEFVYTDAELRSFPLLELDVDRKPLDARGAEYGTTYDLSKACPRCGTGAVQSSALMLPLTGFPKKGLLCATNKEILVAGPLADALREDKVTGLELRQVRLHGNDEPLPWWQMISSYVMPKLSPETKGVIFDRAYPPCPVCRRDGRCGTVKEPSAIAYKRGDVDAAALPDVVQTWECFATSGIHKENPRFSCFAPPLILVKPKVFDIFRLLKVKHARFEPVRIVD